MVYRATKNFPKEELYVLASQLRRCAISISSNVAEGFSRITRKDKRQFCFMALGSLIELQSQLLVLKDLDYIKKEDFKAVAEKIVTVSKLINGLLKTAEEKSDT